MATLGFELAAPNIVHELPVRDTSLAEVPPPNFTEDGFVQSLHEAVDCLVPLITWIHRRHMIWILSSAFVFR